MTNRYRIVSDEYLGFEVQIQYWWLPFIWFEVDDEGIGTYSTIDEAMAAIHQHRSGKPKKEKRKVYYTE